MITSADARAAKQIHSCHIPGFLWLPSIPNKAAAPDLLYVPNLRQKCPQEREVRLNIVGI